MQQFLAFGVASAVLFTAGLIAGQGVNPSDESLPSRTTAPNVDANGIGLDIPPLKDSVDSNTAEAPEEMIEKPMPSPVMNASHQRQEEVTDRYFFSSADAAADAAKAGETTPTQDTESPSLTVAPDPEARKQLESLIRRMFPDAKPDTISVWAEAYDGMDLGEAEFILEQKRAMSGSLDSEIATAMLGTPLGDTSIEALFPSKPWNGVEHAQNAIRQNLQSAWSCGYRKIVIMPEAVIASAELPPGTPRTINYFTSFETGRLQASPVPTHVAISSSSEWMMFCLEGNIFTRRGDFQRLADGRLGIISSHGNYPLIDCTPIPESATSVRITADGEVKYDHDGQTSSAGQLRIMELPELHTLTTSDGVFFHSESPAGRQVTASEAQLAICKLELSSVDVANEKELLQMLRMELP